MEQYKVHITRTAYRQMEEIRHYISNELLSPAAARRVLSSFQEAAMSLESLPSRYPLVSEEPWHTQGIRKMIVANFIMYYWIDERQSLIQIIAVVYERRDQLQELWKMETDPRKKGRTI